jgi:glutamate-1-semialdehyde 2,1-aminomutase
MSTPTTMNAQAQLEQLTTALQEANELYTSQNPLSKAQYDSACKCLPGGNTRAVLFTSPFPLTFKSGNSCYLHSLDGQQYIDFLSEYTAGIYGHNNPVIRKAVEKALDGGWNLGGQGEVEAQLAKIVCERFPSIELVRFVNSGTEANTMALATALVYTGKKKILLFSKGYHGSVISGRTAPGKKSINLPHDFIVGTYNDVAGTEALLSSLPKDSLAAILVEPMLGSGGCFRGTPEFLRSLREAATKYNALLIFDEVMTSRLSYHGLGHTTGITPEITTLGKWIGGGMSFGAFGGKKEIMKLFDPRNGTIEHPGTFNNNVFSMNAGVAGCGVYNAEAVEKLNELGDRLREGVESVLKAHSVEGNIPNTPVTDELLTGPVEERPPVVFVKGIGSLLAIHFVGSKGEYLKPLFWQHMVQNGIYLAQRGFVSLNMELMEEHVDKFVQAVDGFCSKYVAYLK